MAADHVVAAAYAGASDKTIAAMFDVTKSTLQRHFGAVLVKTRAWRKVSLHQMQWAAAEGGSAALLIWLGKQPEEKGGLGQREQLEFAPNLDFSTLSDDELVAIAAGKAKPRLRMVK